MPRAKRTQIFGVSYVLVSQNVAMSRIMIFALKSGEKGVFIYPMKPLKIAILACVVAKLDV